MNRMEKAFREDCARNMAHGEPGVIPSKQLAEQAIAGMADIVRELNELRLFKAGVPWPEIQNAAYHAHVPEVLAWVAAHNWQMSTPKQAGE